MLFYFCVYTALSETYSSKAKLVSRPDTGDKTKPYAFVSIIPGKPLTSDDRKINEANDEVLKIMKGKKLLKIMKEKKLYPNLPSGANIDIEMALPKGFFEKGGLTQTITGRHITLTNSQNNGECARCTDAGKEVLKTLTNADKATEKDVMIKFTPKAIVSLPTMMRKNDKFRNTIKGFLGEDKTFQKNHTYGKKIQLSQIGLAGDIQVFDGTTLLWEKEYEQGKFGNPHVTLVAIRADSDKVMKLNDDAQKRLQEEVADTETNGPLTKDESILTEVANAIFVAKTSEATTSPAQVAKSALAMGFVGAMFI